jgi:hypothetical protein
LINEERQAGCNEIRRRDWQESLDNSIKKLFLLLPCNCPTLAPSHLDSSP